MKLGYANVVALTAFFIFDHSNFRGIVKTN